MNPIEVRNLRKVYGQFVAVDDLSLTVNPGDIYGFLGPNGAGKSTTIRCLLGLVRPTSGMVSVFGSDIRSDLTGALRRIGAIVEKPDFYKFLSGKDNLKIFARMSGIKPDVRMIDKMLETVGLTGRGDDPVKGYSHGMKQRLGLAQALLHDPELIILDEPTTGLDPQGIVDLRNLIRFLRDSGKTIFLSSHILSEIELIASRMVIISKGKAIAEGTVSELLGADEMIVHFSLSDHVSAKSLIAASRWSESMLSDMEDGLKFRLNRAEVPKLNQWFCDHGMEVNGIDSRRKLEDYFMKLTR